LTKILSAVGLAGQISLSPGDTAIVSAIISMSQNLKLRVIAEGVETAEELAFLQLRGCDEAQGYYFSRPVPPERFAALLMTEQNSRAN
jgi:EAL domain-containing protein (putative c-di-GMP-specific phosphodiesterase class I)